MVKGFFTPREVLAKIRSVFTQADMRKGVTSYKLAVKEGRADAAQLETYHGADEVITCRCRVTEDLLLSEFLSRTIQGRTATGSCLISYAPSARGPSALFESRIYSR